MSYTLVDVGTVSQSDLGRAAAFIRHVSTLPELHVYEGATSVFAGALADGGWSLIQVQATLGVLEEFLFAVGAFDVIADGIVTLTPRTQEILVAAADGVELGVSYSADQVDEGLRDLADVRGEPFLVKGAPLDGG